MPRSAFQEEDSNATTSQQQAVMVTDFFPPGSPFAGPSVNCGLLIKLKEKCARANQEGRGEEFRACPERKGAGAAHVATHFRG